MLSDKTILITGGTGSFGKKFIQTVLDNFKPKKLIVFSRDELKQYEMSLKWGDDQYPCIRYFLGDVRDKERLIRAFQDVDYVVHAAALKQVPAAEYNPTEFVKTNVIGAMNIIDAALYNNVKKVVTLSTDKACNPINLYGATKLCADKLFSAANSYRGQKKDTVFSIVRYGNVIGSRGSVIPLFKKLAKTGVLPITDPNMTRFWITLEQGVQFVLKVLEIGKDAEIFVPKIPSMKIADLAKVIDPNCSQDIIGIRPGEKIHEILIGEDEGRNTVEYEDFYVVCQNNGNNIESLLNTGGKKCYNNFEYTSDQNNRMLNTEDLRLVLKRLDDDSPL